MKKQVQDISVLTEKNFFDGSLEILKKVKILEALAQKGFYN